MPFNRPVLIACVIFFGTGAMATLPENPYMSLYKRSTAIKTISLYSQISELEQKLADARAREQSTANKTLGAATMLATGIGGMQLMAGLAESRADQEAERDMKAYLATFTCDCGHGRNIKGGDVGIELPGGNDLMALRQVYITLAADLKERKEALGLSAGIESEVVADKSETGLYDDAGVGRSDGGYTSLSRALTDKDSADAQAWLQQKSDTGKKVKVGVGIAGAGIVGGIAGDILINSGQNNINKVDKINTKYDMKSRGIETDMSEEVGEDIPK